MNWINRLFDRFSGPVSLAPEALLRLAAWQDLEPAPLDRPHFETRYVVINTEASGLDPDRDHLLAVAAIAIEDNAIHPARSYYAPLDQDPVEALLGLLEFTGKSPVIAFNAPFHRELLRRTVDAILGTTPGRAWTDLYWVLPSLFDEHHATPVRLSAWLNTFGITTFQRHHALGDAYAIAQLVLPTLARAAQHGCLTAAALQDADQQLRRLLRVPG